VSGENIHFLRSLVMIESHAAPSTFNDDGWAQATQHAGLVVFSWIQLGDDHIVVVQELSLACWTSARAGVGAREAQGFRAWDTEDVAARRDHCLLVELRAAFERVAAKVIIHLCSVVLDEDVVGGVSRQQMKSE
jgi:hypothetical protein